MKKLAVFFAFALLMSLFVIGAAQAGGWGMNYSVAAKGEIFGSGGSEHWGSTVAGSEVFVKSVVNTDPSVAVNMSGSMYSKSKGQAGSNADYFGKGRAVYNYGYGYRY